MKNVRVTYLLSLIEYDLRLVYLHHGAGLDFIRKYANIFMYCNHKSLFYWKSFSKHCAKMP